MAAACWRQGGEMQGKIEIIDRMDILSIMVDEEIQNFSPTAWPPWVAIHRRYEESFVGGTLWLGVPHLKEVQ